jgi:ABC-type sugar transport system permease subunit
VLPFAVAGIVWAWILAPEDGALNETLRAVGLGSLREDWLGNPKLALYTVMGVMVWVQIGFPLIVFMAGLQRVDPSLYEAAEIDGASWWRRFWYITIPQIRPELYVVLLICTVAAIKSFDKVYILTGGGPGNATRVPAFYSWQNFFEKTQVGYGAAIATVLTLITVVLTVVFLRRQARAEEANA